MPLRRTSRATAPRQMATRQGPSTPTWVPNTPLHRGTKLEPSPSDNDTGVPLTPSDKDPNLPTIHPAKDDTQTDDWASTTASQQDSDEDRDTPADRLPQKIETVDTPPSPADLPDDMKFDPGGEGTPGIKPPSPADVPENRDSGSDSDDPDKMDYLLPM